MCYNKTSSIRAAVIGIIGCILLYNSKSVILKKLALFFAFVSLMQIYDAIFWESLSDSSGKNNINFIFTKIAMITNHLQPLVLAYLISTVILLNNTSKIVLYIYILVAFIYSVNAYHKITYTLVSPESAPSLYWEWNNLDGVGNLNYGINANIMYTLFLITFCVISIQLPFPLNYILTLINLLTFAFSKYNYKNTELGRMWCHIACYVPLFLYQFNSVIYLLLST